MRNTIENTIAKFISPRNYLVNILAVAYKTENNTDQAKLDQYREGLQNFYNNTFTKSPEINALNNVQKTYSFNILNNRYLSDDERQQCPTNYGIDNIKEANISNDNLTKFAGSLLIYDLLYNNNLNISEAQSNTAWTDSIFNVFEGKAQDLVDTYNEIRQSEFMTKMREKYIENDLLKPGLTYSQVAEEMMSLENKDITGYDKFCHFFSYILKGITALFTLGNYVYQSTKDEKEENNRLVESWSQFAKEYKEKTKVEGPAIQ